MTWRIEKFGKIIPWNYNNYKMGKIVKNSHFRNLELDKRNATNLKLFFLKNYSALVKKSTSRGIAAWGFLHMPFLAYFQWKFCRGGTGREDYHLCQRRLISFGAESNKNAQQLLKLPSWLGKQWTCRPVTDLTCIITLGKCDCVSLYQDRKYND